MLRNRQPIGLLEIARKTGASLEEVREVFVKGFGSYEAYVDACLDGTIEQKLTDIVDRTPGLAEAIKRRRADGD